MKIVENKYIKSVVPRFNKEPGFPYYSYKDFEGLKQEKCTFNNSKGVEIHYFFYYYDNYRNDKIILFCPGIGPGHTAYLKEINLLAKQGYKVLTLDYTGCGESGGERLASMNMPTLDSFDLLDELNLKEEVVLVGHSLGGYTSLNLIQVKENIKKAVILSGFLSLERLMKSYLHSNLLTKQVLKYEKRTLPEYFGLDGIEYLRTTKDKIFYIQSTDDHIVFYSVGLKIIEELNNPYFKTLKMHNRKHNPNYSDAAIKYMSETFGEYSRKLKKKEIKTAEDKINYFKNISLEKLTEQDPKVFEEIFKFLEE